jgi:hypothetical protein
VGESNVLIDDRWGEKKRTSIAGERTKESESVMEVGRTLLYPLRGFRGEEWCDLVECGSDLSG